MKKSLSFTLLVIAGLMLFSIASCGGSEYSYEYEERDLGETYPDETYVEETTVVASFKPFPIYTDARSPDNHYVPSGYMGDYSDIKIDATWFDNPHSGTTSLKIVYSNTASQGARWAGVYWLNPANNWGDREGGFDLTGSTKLTFWARGENGDERIEEFKIGDIKGLYSDSDNAGIGPVVLTKEWKQYEINLRGKDLSYISGGFAWATNLDVNPDGATFYLDDIRYE